MTRSRSWPGWTIACALSLAAGLTLPGCDQDDPAPWSVDLGGLSLPTGGDSDFVDKTLTFFAGNSASFQLTLDLSHVAEDARITALSGSGTELARYPEDGGAGETVSIDFPGNVGMLHFATDGITSAPLASGQTVVFNPIPGFTVPEVEDELADQVGSMPVRLGEPVELFFPTGRMRYFFTVGGVAGKTLDIVLDGPGNTTSFAGQVFINSDHTQGFIILDPDLADTPDESGQGFQRIIVDPARDTLLLTVESLGNAGHGRLTVLEADDDGLLSVTMRLVGPFVGFDPVAAMTGAMPAVNQALYRATAGQVRIADVTIFTSPFNPFNLVDDIYLLPPQGFVPPAQLLGKIVFSVPMPPDAVNATGLARLILNAKLELPLEEDDGVPVCPNSMMGNGAFRLCWGENHNPDGSTALPDESSWELLADELGIDPPSRSPADVLRFVSSVLFPISVSEN